MKKLLLLLILSFFSAQGLAAGCPDGSEPVRSISDDGTYFVYNCGNSSNDGGAKTTITAFDGSYYLTISRYNENDGSQDLGNGYIEINNGIMTVAKEGRTLDTGSIDLYDSFEGQIDKDGNISAVFTVNALVGVGSPEPIDFRGTIGALQIKGTFDHYFDMVIKFKRGSYEGSPEAIFDEIKKSIDDDDDGILQLKEISVLAAPHAINPVSVSDFSIIGKTSIRFESNDGECGQEPKLIDPTHPRWSDCDNDRERIELYYGDESWKTEKWYRFYLYLPKDYNSIAPAKMSLIQWKRIEPSLGLIMFQHMHAGLTFNRNGDTFPNSQIVLKSNEDLLGNWTEIIFNTNWHPDPKKGFMKVWIDGKLKVDFKGRANTNSITGRKLGLRYGLYSSWMSNYKNTFKTKKMPQRIAFYDGVKAEKNCQKLLDLNTCENLVSQNIKEYKLFMHNSDDKELHLRSICKISSASFETAATRDDYDPLCTFVKPTESVKKASEASSAFDDSLTLDNLTIPDNWHLVKDKKAFEKARLILKRLIPKMDGLDENACLSMVKDWRNSMKLLTSGAGKKQKDESSAYGSNNSDIGTDIQDCLDKLIYTTQNYTGTPNYMKQILLHWAKTDAVFIPNGVQNDILDDYIYMAVQSWSSLGSYYGTFYDEFNYSDAERNIVDAYIKDKLLNINTRNLINIGKTCDPDNLERTVEGQFSTDPRNGIDNDSCGSSVWKTIPAQLLVGLRLNDKALFKKGIENTKYQLSFFEDSGIFTTWAIKGSASYKYTSHVPVMLGGLTEIYASVGYDFMEHKLRNGLSVKQLMDRQYELFDDPHLLDSWVKRYPHDYKGTPNSVYLQSSVEQIRNDAGLNLFAFVRNLPRYIDTYRADIGSSQEFDKKLGKQSHDVKQKVAAMSSGSFQPLDPYLVYISHITEPEVSSSETTKITETTKVATSDSDPTVSKVIEVIHGDTFIVDIAEPHELAGSNIKLIIRDANTPDASKSCSRQMELGIKVKDIVTQKLADASSIKLINFRKTNTAVIAQVIVDGKDLGEELIAKGYASNEYGHWKAYFCSALQAMAAGDSNWKYGTVDVDKAIFWYERAIFLDPDRDQKLVTYDLSMIYMMNGDTKKSIDYLKQSAELGYMKAEEDLGAAYMNGNGVSKNLAQAKKWLKKAYENGSDSAEDICGCKF